MAYLRKRNGVYNVGFRYGGKEYHRSCETKDEDKATTKKKDVQRRIEMLRTGDFTLPEDADPATWIFTGGEVTSKPQVNGKADCDRLDVVCAKYLREQRHKLGSTIVTEKIHIGHLERLLRPSTRLSSITAERLSRYRDKRTREKCRGSLILDATAKKELVTFRQIWMWAWQNGYVETQCPLIDRNGRWKIIFEKRNAREKFRTWDQIERRIKRGGLTEDQVKELWGGLYLDQGQVSELLLHANQQAGHSFIYPMFAFAAYTGARRSEILRSQIDDFDFETNLLTIRERKRKKRRKGSTREIPIHPNLKTVMEAWFDQHPGGNFTIAPPPNMPHRKKRLSPSNRLTAKQAHHHFEITLRGSKWSVVRGFHVLRHSFGSNLIRSGTVSSDVVAKWMGHSTMEMRELYQHLFPQDGVEQIKVLS